MVKSALKQEIESMASDYNFKVDFVHYYSNYATPKQRIVAYQCIFTDANGNLLHQRLVPYRSMQYSFLYKSNIWNYPMERDFRHIRAELEFIQRGLDNGGLVQW